MAELVCPTCRKKFAFASLAEIQYRPFCSERCRLVDLGKWLSEEYKISEPLDDAQTQPPSSKPRDRDDG
jgi:uncharacterized protein